MRAIPRVPAVFLWTAVLFAATLIGSAPGLSADDETEATRAAIELYESGRYEEAGKALAAIDAAGKADGSLLYRLAYCQRVTGDSSAAEKTQARARTELERQMAGSRDLQVAFYLVNTYENLGLHAERAKLAAETTAAVERGEMNADRSIDRFRVGKLYADQGKAEIAAQWYERSLDASGEAGVDPNYQRWAARYLADRAFERKDFNAAVGPMKILGARDDATMAELDRLAVALAHNGDYFEAGEAWRRAEKLNPAEANRARYCARLCALADKLGGLPGETPGGVAWGSLTKEHLETLMSEQAEIAKQVLAEAHAEESLTEKERTAYRDRLKQIQGVFVATALEYALRGHGIRETSFFSGYAPLIMRRSAWNLPKRDMTPKQREKAKVRRRQAGGG